MSVQLFPSKEVQEDEVLLDTTVQEKNIIFPTDVKLQKKIIGKCRKKANRKGIELRQTYKRELKQLMIDQHFHSHPRRKKKAKAAARRIKIITAELSGTLTGRWIASVKKNTNPNLYLIF